MVPHEQLLLPQDEKTRRSVSRKTIIITAVALGALLVLCLAGTAAAMYNALRDRPLETVQEICDPNKASTQILDDGRTLVLDMKNSTDQQGAQALRCVMVETKMPGADITRLGQTRALDGVQEAAWSDYEASWTYHPEAGLDIVVQDM